MKPTLLIISQVYVPDPTAVGQYMHDAAAAMVQRGYRVVVYTSARGYDDPTQRYPRRETRDGVLIRRLPFSSFGKSSIKVRLAAQLLFLAQATLRGLFTRRLSHILISTSPPMAGAAGLFLHEFRKLPGGVTFWAMDINPDQTIAMGKTTPDSRMARAFDAMNRRLLRRSRAVVALDRFMAETLEAKHPVGDRMHIIPPWPLDEHLEPVAHADNPFRAEHGLADKFVIMYSGNISPAHPIDTILEAARQFKGDDNFRGLVFLFIGGKAARESIDAYAAKHGLTGLIRTLPYQPLDRIKYSLSAADVHLVAMGDNMVGLVHPCKVYGVMAVQRPILLLGPARCHINQIIADHHIGWQVNHGDVDGMVRVIRDILTTPPAPGSAPRNDLAAMGQRAHDTMRQHFSKQQLCKRFCDVLEGKQALGFRS